MRNLLITGGAGFIGSNFVRYTLGRYPDCRVVVYDKLTYAGNLENLRDLESDPRYTFLWGDICDAPKVEQAIQKHQIQAIVNFAAETHVDRSLLEPGSFLMTDVYGTYVLLEAARRFGVQRFVQISTDEVYGPIPEGAAHEGYPLNPTSPYSASKAGADMLVLAYHASFGLPVLITRGSNNFGPYQYPEKFIPLLITNALEDQPLPIYGDGRQVRDWIYVLDHCEGVDLVLRRGEPGQVYNIGGGNERQNLEVTETILGLLNKPRDLLQHVTDRPGHDRRYSLDCTKLKALGWQPQHGFEEALQETLSWYRENRAWWKRIKSGEYAEYYRRNYGQRLSASGGRSEGVV